MFAVILFFNPIIINQSWSKEHNFILVKPDPNASLSGEGFWNLHECQGRDGYGKAWQALEEEKMIWITMKTTMTTTMTMITTWHLKVGEDLWNIFDCQVNTGDRNTANTNRTNTHRRKLDQTYISEFEQYFSRSNTRVWNSEFEQDFSRSNTRLWNSDTTVPILRFNYHL